MQVYTPSCYLTYLFCTQQVYLWSEANNSVTGYIHCIVTCTSIARKLLGKHIPAAYEYAGDNRITSVAMQRRCKYNSRISGVFCGPPRDYISNTEQNQNENGARPRQSWKKGSAEDLLLL
jgi:hypothetical protein